MIRDAGLRPDARIVTISSCMPSGVIDQQPAAGAVRPRGAEVVLELNADGMGVCGLGMPRAAPVADRVAREFVAFSRGDRAAAPLAPSVGLYVGDRLMRTAPSGTLGTPDGWRLCPPEGHYAARTCPFSAVESIRAWPDQARLAYSSVPAAHPCLHTRTVSPELAGLVRVTVQADEALACPSYWAVELFVDESGLIAAAKVLWAEP